MARDIRTVGVVGLGTMGAGIAEVVARGGLDVVGVEVDQASADAARARIEASTQAVADAGDLTAEERTALLGRIEIVTDLDRVAAADLVVEAVPERLELKRELFAKLDSVLAPGAVLATNTSSLSVTELAVGTQNPGRVVGLHFANPAPEKALVEVARTVITEPDVLEDVVALAERLGKTPVVVGDRAGFVTTALLFAYLNHAVSMYEQRYASREDIDAAMRFGCGLPMGPLAVLDLVGLDTAYDVLDSLYRQGGDRLHAPAPIIKQMVAAGLTGRKAGRGFYTYEAPGSATVVADALTPAKDAASGEVRPVQSVGVIGSGTMATGIIEVFAKAGFDVTFVARGDEKVARVQAGITKSLDRAVSKGRLDAAKRDEVLGRITGTTALTDLADVDLVVEAVVEELSVKQTLFKNLDEICKPGAILATTTSSLPVVECAAVTSRPQDVVGMHFFNPAPVMKLVEVVSPVTTGADVTATITDITRRIGKHPVDCGDRAGFIVNALLFPYLNDAVKLLAAHYATTDDIDTAVKLGFGYPMGPFELLDVVGLDVSLAIERTLYGEFREPGFAPSPLLEHLVTAGYLGRKTGRGFRAY